MKVDFEILEEMYDAKINEALRKKYDLFLEDVEVEKDLEKKLYVYFKELPTPLELRIIALGIQKENVVAGLNKIRKDGKYRNGTWIFKPNILGYIIQRLGGIGDFKDMSAKDFNDFIKWELQDIIEYYATETVFSPELSEDIKVPGLYFKNEIKIDEV